VIPEVLDFAAREATIERRRSLAALIRARLVEPGRGFEDRVAAAANELEALASELEDTALVFDPVSAVACARLLNDLDGSPLLNPERPPLELRARVRRIRAGFRAGELAA